VWLWILAVSPLLAQERKPEVRVENDLVFGKGGDKELKLDPAMPKDGDGPFPAVLCIHGGSILYDRATVRDLIRNLESTGRY
jgi:hypothetical protein